MPEEKTSRTVLFLDGGDFVLLFRKEILLSFLRQGWRVAVALPPGNASSRLQEEGIEVITVPLNRRGMNPVRDVALFFTYRKILRLLRPDLVFTFTIKPNVYGGFAARLAKIPYHATMTGLGSAIQNPGILRSLVLFLYRLGVRRASAIFCQNESIGAFLCEKKVARAEQLVFVPGSGVNLDRFSPIPYPEDDETIRFLFISRLMRDKGIEEFALAARSIRERYPQVTFEILGQYEENYEEFLHKLIADGVVLYSGYQSDTRPFFKKTHAIIHPSYHEGMSNVLLEAAACGRPILASNIPGCREIFDEGVSGLGFAPRSADALIKAIETFIQLPYEQKRAYGLAAREKVATQFDRQKVIQIYQSVAEKTCRT